MTLPRPTPPLSIARADCRTSRHLFEVMRTTAAEPPEPQRQRVHPSPYLGRALLLVLALTTAPLLTACLSSSGNSSNNDEDGSNGEPNGNSDRFADANYFALQVVDYRDENDTTGHVTLRFRGLDAVTLDEESDNGNVHPGAASAQGTDDPFAHLPGRYTASASAEEGFEELQVDATDGWAYVNLNHGAVVADPDADDWHVALNRFRVRLNSGPSGPGEVHGALGLQPPKALYSTDSTTGEPDFDTPLQAVFIAAEPRQHVARLVETAFTDPANSVSEEWQADRLVPAIGDEFWDLSGGMGGPPDIVADNSYGWLVRGRDGESHARMRVTDLLFEMTGDKDFEYELTMNIAAGGDGDFGDDVVFGGTLPRVAGGEACFDFVSATPNTVDCSGGEWDLLIYFDGTEEYVMGSGGSLFGILLNGGSDRDGNARSGDAAVFGAMDSAAMAWTDGGDGLGDLARADDSDLFDMAMAMHQDQPGGLFEEYPWHELLGMGIQGGPVWPNYRVYLLRVEAEADD